MLTSPKAIGLFGGTFDPAHQGHLRLASVIYTQLRLKEIRLIPCAQPLLRDPPRASAEQRLRMLELLAEDYHWLKIDELEIKRGGPSYSIDTLQALREEMPDVPLCFIMSADQFIQFDQWRSWQDILELTHLVVANRPGYPLLLNDPLQRFVSLHQTANANLLHSKLAGAIFFATIPALAISATAIRTALRTNKSTQHMLSEKLRRYIVEQRLYST